MVDKVAAVERWVDAWQAGRDREGHFRRLFDRYSPVLFAFFRKRGFTAEHCEDLVQETFLGVYRGLPGFRHEAPFESWLFELAANVFRKTIRRRSAKKRDARIESLDERILTPAGEPDATVAAPGSDPAEVTWAPRAPPTALRMLLGKERLRKVLEGLDQLPAQMRRCAIMAWCDGYRNHEIATLLQISPQTVKVHQFKARQRLREQLGAMLEIG